MSSQESTAQESTATLPRVVVVLVVHNGDEWLPTVLETVAAQTYPELHLVVVDNASTDSSAEVLARRIPAERLVTLPKRVGFGRAAAAGLRETELHDGDLLMFWHDDLALAPDALHHLVAAVTRDPQVAIVGPKLRLWSAESVLSEVGMTVDRFGRAETLMDRDELDQGQHDHRQATLYVSTAGMLMRPAVLHDLRGLDPRFPLMRDDLDLCWRAWLAGHRVEVVPEAIGYHVVAGTRLERRIGRGRAWEGRYLSERHAVATLLKNYGVLSLLWVLPVVVLLACAKFLAFLATRRFGDANATVRAYGWNVLQLPRTLRARRAVQRMRSRRDRELRHLFAPGLPRVRDYVEALANWLAGGSTRALIEEDEGPPPAREGDNALVRVVRDHTLAIVGTALLAVYLVGLVPLLGDGQLVGGRVMPWPESPREFLRAYASPWNGQPAATGAFASPVQAALGIGSFLGLGSTWLAQRLLVLGLVPLAWMIAVRAGRLLTMRPAPRVLGATLYVLSPAVLGALATGRYGELVVATLLPGLVLVGVRAADASSPPASAWRATAWLLLGTALAVAAAPPLAVLVVVLGVGLAVTALRPRPNRRQAIVRLLTAGAGALLILAPWLADLARYGSVFLETIPAHALPAWRAVTVAPALLPGGDDLLGVLAAATTVAVVLAALLLSGRLRPVVVTSLVAVVAVSGAAAWAASRWSLEWVWVPSLLLPAALAVGGLGVVAARDLGRGLGGYAFGARQLAVVAVAGVLGLGVVTSAVQLGAGPWPGLALSPELTPLFVGADTERVGPYRVLLLDVADGELHWEVTGAGGPSMVSFGTVHSDELLAFVGAQVAGIAGNDPRAGERLGMAGIRYVVVHDAAGQNGAAAELADRLAAQPALEPLASSEGNVLRVRTWLPRAAVVPEQFGRDVVSEGFVGDTAGLEGLAFQRLRPGLYRGVAPSDAGILLLTEAPSPLWRATAEEGALDRLDPEDETWPVNAFVVPPGSVLVSVMAGRGILHTALVALQALVVLAALSLALRPPRFTQSSTHGRTGGALPRFGDNGHDDGVSSAGRDDEVTGTRAAAVGGASASQSRPASEAPA